MLCGKVSRLKRLVSSLRSRPFWCVFRLCFLKKGTQPRKLRKLILPAVKRGNDGGGGGGGMERRHIKFCKQNTARLIVLRKVFCLQNLTCLLFIFADQVFIDTTFSGVLVCGPLQSMFVLDRKKTKLFVVCFSRTLPHRFFRFAPYLTTSDLTFIFNSKGKKERLIADYLLYETDGTRIREKHTKKPAM